MTKKLGLLLILIGCLGIFWGCEQEREELKVSPETLHFAPEESLKFIDVTYNGKSRLAVAVQSNKDWLRVTPTEFVLGPNDKVSIQVYLDRDYAHIEKAYPSYSTGTVFINSFLKSQSVPVTTAPNYFTEIFEGNVDLMNRSLTFVPNKSINVYQLTVNQITKFPVDTTGATPIGFTQKQNVFKLVIPENRRVLFYEKSYDTLFISANGWVGFGEPKKVPISPTTDPKRELMYYFYAPQLTAFPVNALAGGKVTYQILQNRVVITYENVPTAGREQSGQLNSFQIELFFTGKISLYYLNLDTSATGIVGLSFGAGQITIPSGFVETDLVP